MYKVDINSDLGESFGAYTIGMDTEVIAHVSSANVASFFKKTASTDTNKISVTVTASINPLFFFIAPHFSCYFLSRLRSK